MTDRNVSITCGQEADADRYECACGYVLNHQSGGPLPTCPNDEGHHTVKAWQPVQSNRDLDSSLPNSPLNPDPAKKPKACSHHS